MSLMIVQRASKEAGRNLLKRQRLKRDAVIPLQALDFQSDSQRFFFTQACPLQRSLAYPSLSTPIKAYFSINGAPQVKKHEDVPVTSMVPPQPVKPLPSPRLSTTRVPTPPSAPPETRITPQSALSVTTSAIMGAVRATGNVVVQTPGVLWYYFRHPAELRAEYQRMKQMVQDEAHHYWVGTKVRIVWNVSFRRWLTFFRLQLLFADVRTARTLIYKTLTGSSLTRRERKQLLRTVSDLFRVVPFSMFIIIPLGELALPFVLRIFPNLLPSTYQDSLKQEENMKRELQSRIAMAHFFGETLEELAKEQQRKAGKRTKELQEAGVDGSLQEEKDSAASMLEFLENARNGQMIPPDVIIRYASYFQDDLTLDNMPRMQLVNMCKYMNIPPYGSDAFLRFQLRFRIRSLREDDQKILWEGIDSLTKMELREACQERGMRSTGLSKESYKTALQQWLELSVEKHVPIALLIMSRTFMLSEDVFATTTDEESEKKRVAGLADAISGMDKEVLNEVILEVATSEEKKSNPDVAKIKLEVVETQNELIREEAEALEYSKRREKEKAEKNEAEKLEAQALPTTEGTEEVLTADAQTKAAATEDDDDDDIDLSPHEMDAMSQLVSEDPVGKERADLEKIKCAIEADEEVEVVEAKIVDISVEDSPDATTQTTPTDGDSTFTSSPMSSEEADKMVKATIETQTAAAEKEATAMTTFESEGVKEEEPKTAEEKVNEEDPVVARLKKRVKSMVAKIEAQLTETETKIGDKLHFLDKDKDGNISQDELALVLMQVLKRDISVDEAREIANQMDENQDGILTVQEFQEWINDHKVEHLLKEGRDIDFSLLEKDKEPVEDLVSEEEEVSMKMEATTARNALK